MKLTTMKISVPVLMLMMFQSGYGVSDWFEKAWGLMNQGKKAEAYAVVKQAHPEKVKPIYDQDRDQCLSVWSKAVSDAVSENLPLCYYNTEGKLTHEGDLDGEALRNELIELNDEGIISSGEYYDLVESRSETIDAEAIKYWSQNTIAYNSYNKIMDKGQPSAWLLPDNDLLAGFIDPSDTGLDEANKHAGVYAWAGRIATKWLTEGEEQQKVTHNKNLLKNKEGTDTDLCVIDLRNDINLTGEDTESDLTKVYVAIQEKATAAHIAVSTEGMGEEAKTAAVEALANALRDELEIILDSRIQSTTEQTQINAVSNYLKVAFNKNIDSEISKTVKPYYSESGLLIENPLNVILQVANNKADPDPTSSGDITLATRKVIADDLSLLLRRDGEQVDIFDENVDIIDSTGTAVDTSKVHEFLLNNVQFDDDVTDSVVENLQLIKDNWVEPDSDDESD